MHKLDNDSNAFRPSRSYSDCTVNWEHNPLYHIAKNLDTQPQPHPPLWGVKVSWGCTVNLIYYKYYIAWVLNGSYLYWKVNK